MLEINGRFLCNGCFRPVDASGACSCGFTENSADSLKSGTVLNGRYVTGREIRKSKTVKEYLCYDSQGQNIVIIKEFFSQAFVKRNGGTAVELKAGDLDSYNAAMQKFIALMKIPQNAEQSGSFIKVKGAFYENNTAYFIVENHPMLNLSGYIQNYGRLSDDAIIKSMKAMVNGLLELDANNSFNGNISADNVYVGNNGVIVDGFELNEDELAPMLKDSLVFERKANYMSPSDFGKAGKSILSDVFSVGAVLYTMLTAKTPGSPFDGQQRFDVQALESSTNNKQLLMLVKRMCGIGCERYASLNDLAADAGIAPRNKKSATSNIPNQRINQTVEMNQPPKKTGSKKILIIAVAAVLLAAVIALTVFLIKGRNKNEEAPSANETVTSTVSEKTSESVSESATQAVQETVPNTISLEEALSELTEEATDGDLILSFTNKENDYELR